MQLSPDLKVSYAPRLREVEGLSSEEEKAHFDFVQSNLDEMSRQAQSLVAAIALFEFCGNLTTEDRLSTDWQFVAARDGAMSIRNFAHAIANVRGSVGKVPTWRERVDLTLLKSAHLQFQKWFPFAHKLRHSIAHPELYTDPKKKMGSANRIDIGGIAISRGGGNTVINQGLFNRTFACTFEGEVVEYELSRETSLRAVETCRLGFESFRNAAGWMD